HPPNDHLCDQLDEIGHTEPVRVVLDRTPFYGESGGQVGDTGRLVGEGFEFKVTDTQKDGQLVIHIGDLTKGTMREGAKIKAIVDDRRRSAIGRAHSATHILHYALQKNLGSHAQQQGSKVDEDWLRFDFTNLAPVSPEQLAAIGTDVAARVKAAEAVKWETLPLADARQKGAMMLFGEKYPDPVRMVSMGTFSRELCGGTHLTNTGEVESFEILAEEGVSAGTRRITALTGAKAAEHSQQTTTALNESAKLLGVSPLAVPEGVHALQAHARELKKQLAGAGGAATESAKPAVKQPAATAPTYAEQKHALSEAARLLSVASLVVPQRIAAIQADIAATEKQLTERAAAGPLSGEALLKSAATISGVTVVVAELPGVESNLMRQLIDQVRGKTPSSAVLLASRSGEDKVTLVAGISKDLQARKLSAGEWIRPVAEAVGGGGGGRPDLAQAGGKNPARLPDALQIANETIRKMLSA
ncbi:MAG TPA: DHHA1 domain-containing protein, partial [Pirellulales bacterium]